MRFWGTPGYNTLDRKCQVFGNHRGAMPVPVNPVTFLSNEAPDLSLMENTFVWQVRQMNSQPHSPVFAQSRS